MADLTALLETMENRWMRAWVRRDAAALKSATSRNFMLLVGSKPPVILDSTSWVDAATTRWLCSSYRFGDIYARDVGGLALFASQLDLEATMDGQDWSGRVWVTDLWKKGRIRRRWRMVQRVISRVEDKAEIPSAVRALQLWRSTPRGDAGR